MRSADTPTIEHRRAYAALLARLVRAREDAGLSQAQAARAVRRSRSWLSARERGVVLLDVAEFGRLADVYALPPSYFFSPT